MSHTIRKKNWLFLICALSLLGILSGCSGQRDLTRTNYNSPTDLQLWVSKELTPYLVDQLSRQPRFSNEPVLLVAMRDADIQPHIDSLTRSIRQRLLDKLLQSPGTHLARRPNAQSLEHHRTATRPQCQTASSARYFISIDILAIPGNQVNINVRALDVSTGNWVSGFGKTWQGRLNKDQQQAFAQRHTDEYLRGLRVLPFEQGQSDLAAAYIAQNITCVLRGEQSLQANIALDPKVVANPALKQIMTLVSYNISRQRGKTSIDNTTLNSLTLDGNLTDIDATLQQLWVSVKSQANTTQTLLDTAVYLSAVPNTDNEIRQRLAVEPTTQATAQPTDIAPDIEAKPQGYSILSNLRLLDTALINECNGYTPVNCLAIEYDLYQSAYVLLLRQSPDTGLVWMPADGCNPIAEFPYRLSAQTGLRANDLGRIGMSDNIYAIALTNKQLANDLQRHALQLPSGCFGDSINDADPEFALQWLAELDQLLDRDRDNVDWQAINIAQAYH